MTPTRPHHRILQRLRLGLGCALLGLAFGLAAQTPDVSTTVDPAPVNTTAAPDEAPPAAYLNALQAIEQGQTERAERLLNSVIIERPDFAGAWLDLAVLAMRQNRYPEAQEFIGILTQKFSPLPAVIESAVVQMQNHMAAHTAEPLRTPNPSAQHSLILAAGYDTNANAGLHTDGITLTLPNISATLQVDKASQAQGAAYVRAGYAHQASRTWSQTTIGWQLQAQARQNQGLSGYDSLELQPQLTLVQDGLPGQWGAAWQAVWRHGQPLYQSPVLRWQHSQPQGACDWQHLLQLEERQYPQASHLDSHWQAYRSTWDCKNQGLRHKIHLQLARENAATVLRPGGDTRHQSMGLQQDWFNVLGHDQHNLQLRLERHQSQDSQGYNELLDNNARKRVRRTDLQATWSAPLPGQGAWRWTLGLQSVVQKSNIEIMNQRNNLMETSIWRAW